MSTSSDKVNKLYNKSFCTKPFTEISNSASGQRMLCCRSEPVNIDTSKSKSISDDFFNHPVMNEIRRKMLAGETVDECWICTESEKARGQSHRTFTLTNEQGLGSDITNDIWKNGTVSLRSLDIRFGTKCNLACVMCGPGSSSLIAKELNKDEDIYDLNDFSLEQIKQHAENITFFKTTGGEPMLLPAYKKTLEFFVEQGYAKNITFTTITNGTIDYSELMPLMNEFKLFKISHSIDAADQSYDYVRWPGTFSRIERIHNRIIENSKNYPNIRLEFASTIHTLNVDQVVKIAKYLHELGMEDRYSMAQVFDPEYMQPGLVNISILEELKKEAVDWYNQRKIEIRRDIVDFVESIMYNYNEINKDQKRKKLLLDELEAKTIFWKSTRKLDVQDYVKYYKLVQEQ